MLAKYVAQSPYRQSRRERRDETDLRALGSDCRLSECNSHTAVLLAFFLDLGDSDSDDLSRASDVRAAARLQVVTSNLD